MNTTMPAPTHLLERAYQLINANQIESAELVLDAVVRVEPQNVAAWKTYLQILENQSGLDWLKDRVLKTKELSEADKSEIVNYYIHMTQQLNGEERENHQANSFVHQLEENGQASVTDEINIQFELIDVFDYPVKIVERQTRTKPRRRAVYSTFAFDIASGVLKAASRDPLGKKIAAHIQNVITLANRLVKNPKDAYTRLSNSPHFEKSIGIVLLTLFVLGIRLVASNYPLGYLFLGVFIIGGGWWLVNFGSQSASALSSQARVYLSENKNSLPVIKEVETDQEQKSDKDSPKKSVK